MSITGETQTTSKRALDEEDKENDICSLQDVIDCEKEQNEIVSAVLGASDATNCSYDQGFVYRQALYCCKTCLKESEADNNNKGENEEAFLHGICLACSYECHQNHELYELYTKRNFRCDCGNSKFSHNGKTQTCKLQPNKEATNNMNKYNQNFKGLYCLCHKPYPPEAANDSINNTEEENNEEEMLQCTICEDWFHLNHLLGNESFPSNEVEIEEMICHSCMSKNKFLWYYQGYIALKPNDLNSEEPVDVVKVDESNESNDLLGKCVLKVFKEKYIHLDVENINKACCFLNNWREALCKCVECIELYKRNKIEFLIDSHDTIKFYEDCGKKKEAETQQIDENKLLNDELAKLNRVSQVEFLHNVNDFKQELTEFFSNFAQNGKIVKRENIVEFFDELNKRKKRKLEQKIDSSAYYCK